MSRLRDIRRDESGISLAEMLMGMFVFVIVFGAILTMVEGAMKQNERVVSRTYANQKARPVLTRMVDQLHSACVAPGIAPILPGSNSSQIEFLSKTGSAVSPTPDKRVITLSGTVLIENVYLAVSGAPPSWTFSGTPIAPANRILVKGVSAGSSGAPAVPLPVFRYFKYINGQVSPSPLPVPLSADDAAKTVLVEIAFAVSPYKDPASDPAGKVTLTDSTTLRLEPASEDSAELNLPCV